MTDRLVINLFYKRIILTKEKSTPSNGKLSALQVLIRGNGRKTFLQMSPHMTCRTLTKMLQAKRLVQGGRQLDDDSTLFDGAVIDALGCKKGGMNVSVHEFCFVLLP
jgi:hypothetical protein